MYGFSLCSFQLGEREDKGKFTLLHPGGAATKLRADTQQEAENWINIIAASIKRVRFLLVAVLFSCQIDFVFTVPSWQAKEDEIQARLAAERTF